jgi:hypothetical protein
VTRRRVRAAWTIVALIYVAAAGSSTVRAEEPQRFEPSSRGGRAAAVAELAEAHFAPEWLGWAIRTASCESSNVLYARSNGFDRRLGVSYDFWGPWQVDAVTWGATAWELFGGPLSEPHVGAAMAAWIVERYGPGHWPICGR